MYTGVRVRRLSRSIRFYRILGYTPVIRRKTPIGEFALLAHRHSGMMLELNQYTPGGESYERFRSGSELDHLGFWVDDIEGSIRRLRQADGRLKGRIFETTWPVPEGWPVPRAKSFTGRAAYVVDPDGIWIELMARGTGARKRGRSARDNPRQSESRAPR